MARVSGNADDQTVMMAAMAKAVDQASDVRVLQSLVFRWAVARRLFSFRMRRRLSAHTQ
jgi:hypothetical protein